MMESNKVTALLSRVPGGWKTLAVIGLLPFCFQTAALDAVAWVKAAAKKVQGGGGGRPDMAQAGGKKPEGIPDALAEVAAAGHVVHLDADAVRVFEQDVAPNWKDDAVLAFAIWGHLNGKTACAQTCCHPASHVVRWNRLHLVKQGGGSLEETTSKNSAKAEAMSLSGRWRRRDRPRLAMSYAGKRASHIDPPASSNAIMQRAEPRLRREQ